MKRYLHILCFLFLAMGVAQAGNPDRQGEAGASELLLNPWAMSSGVHSMSTAYVSGVEALRINVGGLSTIENSQINVGHTQLYDGSGLAINTGGIAIKFKSGALGISFTSLDFGDLKVTTVDQPEGTGGSFSPSFSNFGIGYSHTFSNKDEGGGNISVGFLVRFVSEVLPTVSSSGLGLDAGVQYASGDNDEFKLGISLRNVGTPMKFGGEGLSFQTAAPLNEGDYNLTVYQRPENFSLPTVLDIGLSYDLYFGEDMMLRLLGNFTSNAFSRDQLGGGIEFKFTDMVTLRGAYRADLGSVDIGENLYTGLAGGVSIDVPLKRAENRKVGIDYAYRTTSPFRGTHNFGLRFGF